MTASDLAGSTIFVAFGLWWLILPDSVIRFYTWFHPGGPRLPSAQGIRLAGALWVALVAFVLWRTFTRR